MSDGPPISILNLGVLPPSNDISPPIRFACIKSILNDDFSQVKSPSCRCQRLYVLRKIWFTASPSWLVSVVNGESGANFIVGCLGTSVRRQSSPIVRCRLRCGLVTCRYTVLTRLSRPAVVEAVTSQPSNGAMVKATGFRECRLAERVLQRTTPLTLLTVELFLWPLWMS